MKTSLFLAETMNGWFYIQRKLETKHYNYLIFGHRHLPMKVSVGENSEYVNLAIGSVISRMAFWWENFEIKSTKSNSFPHHYK
jgi:UDP-2,3-diacylglucosamine hydrolase